jgi:DnaJ-class molecular chaperone
MHYSDDRSKDHVKYPRIHGANSFDILGLPKTSTYDAVKRKFVELALKCHPDTSGIDNGDAEEFIRLRRAFETIREQEDGTASLMENGERVWTDEEFQSWFYEETGHQDIMFRMDMSTRREVIEIAESQSQGGLDRGGMWEMARAMADQEKSLKKSTHSGPPVGIKAPQSPGSGGRRRRRK